MKAIVQYGAAKLLSLLATVALDFCNPWMQWQQNSWTFGCSVLL